MSGSADAENDDERGSPPEYVVPSHGGDDHEPGERIPASLDSEGIPSPVSDYEEERPSGYAFLSYVREDREAVDRIQAVLEAADIPVWRDVDDLWPGEDWRHRIREAITDGALAFVACFSDNSQARDRAYQHEELNLAVEQLRQRPPDRPWFIPVRLDDCAVFPYEIGAGRTLDSLHRVDLFEEWETGAARLVAAVVRIFPHRYAARRVDPPALSRPVRAYPQTNASTQSNAELVDQVKHSITRAECRIELHDQVMNGADAVHDALANTDTFPSDHPSVTSDAQGLKYLIGQASAYRRAVAPMLGVVATLGGWAETDEQARLLATGTERIINHSSEQGGKVVLLEMRRYPGLLIMYASGLAAVQMSNYRSLRAVTVDAMFRDLNGSLPLVAEVHPGRVFSHDPVAQALAKESTEGRELTDHELGEIHIGRTSRRYTPTSDHLHDYLRPTLRDLIRDDRAYTEVFDRLELLLALIALDASDHPPAERRYMPGPWYGSFTWRDRFSSTPLEVRINDEFRSAGANWPPLTAGLLDGSSERAEASFEKLIEQAAAARQQRW